MMNLLELVITYTNGQRQIERGGRNDAAGRRAMEREAFDLLLDPTVATIQVRPTDRTVGFTGRMR